MLLIDRCFSLFFRYPTYFFLIHKQQESRKIAKSLILTDIHCVTGISVFGFHSSCCFNSAWRFSALTLSFSLSSIGSITYITVRIVFSEIFDLSVLPVLLIIVRCPLSKPVAKFPSQCQPSIISDGRKRGGEGGEKKQQLTRRQWPLLSHSPFNTQQ